MHVVLQEMTESSCRDDFLYKPIGHIYTKSYIKHPNEKFYALQSQLFTSDPGWHLNKFLPLSHTPQTE